jgi:hypothetical protein
MTPERVAALVAAWVRFYTRELPPAVAQRRAEELGADLHDHIAHERARGTSERRIALSILSRMVRGLPADGAWRRQNATAGRSTVGVVLAVTFVLLLVPAVAMQFSDEMAWGPIDFALAGVLLAGTGFTFALAARKAREHGYWAALGLAVGTALLLVWLIGAVGVIGEDGDRFDLLYLGVLAVGILGAVLARFQPWGMARALLAMALAQGLVAVIALLAGKQDAAISSVAKILGLNGLFVVLFIGSAWLFTRAARTRQLQPQDQ